MVHVKNKRILSHVSTKNILITTESENNRTMLSHDQVSILFFLFFIGEGRGRGGGLRVGVGVGREWLFWGFLRFVFKIEHVCQYFNGFYL